MSMSLPRPLLTNWVLSAWIGVWLFVYVIGSSPTWAITVTDFPLQPPDTSSPRATMDSFLSNMQEAHRRYSLAMKRYKEEPGLYSSRAVKEEVEDALLFFERARRCLDVSQLPPRLVERVSFEATLLFKTVFDRISIPPLEEIPDADDMSVDERTRWRLPHTDITIAKVSEGPRSGEFLFSPSTIDRIPDDYLKVKHLPHKPGAWVGVYTLYTEISGDIIPDKLIFLLPSWAKTRYLNHPIWKWILLGILDILGIIGLVLIYGYSRPHPKDRPLQAAFRRILFPLGLMIIAYVLDYLQQDIGFRGDIHEWLTKIFLAVTILATGWTILLIGNIFAEGIIASPSTKTKRLDAAMIRVVARIFSFGIAAWVIVVGAQNIGIPLVPLLAGLGVGGLALALSAQPTVENFIGGMTLFADRPVRLGEMVKFGNQLGMVEEIGVRSTRIRTLDRTLVTVPNAEFSKLQLENYTKRDRVWFHPRIRLRMGTTPDQLRFILVEIRKVLYAHPKVLRDPARIRFVGFGAHSLDLDIFAYIDVTDYGEYLEIAEDLNLRMMEVIKGAGSSLAMPVSRKIADRGHALDKQRMGEIGDEVENWRQTQALYLPRFPEETIDDLDSSLEYPPPGSPKPESNQEGKPNS